MDETRRVSAWLNAQGWPAGARIAIISKNCAWWIMAEIAAWMSGFVTVPVYPSLSARAVRTLLEHSQPVACFLGPIDDRTVLTDGIPPGVARVTFPMAADPHATAWNTIVASTSPREDSPLRDADEIATIIYTSGTTGAPKGAMHRFTAFCYFAIAAIRAHGEQSGTRMLCYLSLAHIAERALVESVAYATGAHLYFVENLETFAADLRRARPTIFFSVPRLYVKFQQKVLEKVPQSKLDRVLRVPVLRTAVRHRILKQLGLQCTRLAASGSAALPLPVLLWYRKLGLNLVEGYGMTETGITHTPGGGRSKPGYVGDSIPGVETHISAEGEVLVRSPMNMVGYFRNPEATKQCFTEDGYFRTGDLGELDQEGWLRIIGRAKEQFKTSKGKYVIPGAIEQAICASSLIDACCVMGADSPQPFAVATLAPEMRERLMQPDGRAFVEARMLALLNDVNARFEPHERLEFIVVTDETWTIANGILTPTLKLKRSLIEAQAKGFYAAWRSQNSRVVWHHAGLETAATGS